MKGGSPVRVTVRFTRDGPLLNDLDQFLAGRIPLTALRLAPLGRGTDLDGARAINRARNGEEFAAGISLLDLGCSNWVFADAGGNIGYRSPCLVPIRPGWRGTFPVPGWLRRYDWQGFVPKNDLPASTDPARGWLATANNQIVPSNRFPTSYNTDTADPNRFLRISARLREEMKKGGLTAPRSAAIELDTKYERWPLVRRTLGADLCADRDGDAAAVRRACPLLCTWDGSMSADSSAATLYVLWTNALLDRALADDVPGGAHGEVWQWVQSLLQFEADAQWLPRRPPDDPVWDDVTTPGVETRADIVRASFADAVADGT